MELLSHRDHIYRQYQAPKPTSQKWPLFSKVSMNSENSSLFRVNEWRTPSFTPIMDDNQATITQINKDRLTPRTKQLDIIITWLHYHYNRLLSSRFTSTHILIRQIWIQNFVVAKHCKKHCFLLLVSNSILLTTSNILNFLNFTYIPLVNIKAHFLYSKKSPNLLHRNATKHFIYTHIHSLLYYLQWFSAIQNTLQRRGTWV